MWQKLNRIDTFELEKVRIQLLNAIQLVSAAPRCYSKEINKPKPDWLFWNSDLSSMDSAKFGSKEKVKLSLDIEQFVLSIYGNQNHIEHLVLSGITYPMAFGWLKIKLETFSLNADLYSDETSYSIEHTLTQNDELNVTNQQVFSDLQIYYSNAFDLLNQVSKDLEIDAKPAINPATLNLALTQNKSNVPISFGFSPGNKSYPEPYFFVQLDHINDHIIHQIAKTIGIWNNKDWYGLVLMASEFLSLNPEDESNKILDFFTKNYWRLLENN